MNWCLSWWSPDGWAQGLVALIFWGGVVGTGIWAGRRHRRHQRSAATAGTHDVRPEADDTTQQVPRVGAGGGSTR